MRKLVSIMMVVAMVAIFIGYEESSAEEILSPVVTIGTPIVKMSKKSEVMIMGTGFKPGQELHILFTAADGVQSDVSAYIKPELKVDKTGTWATKWKAGRYVKRKIIKEQGAYAITVAGSDYLPLTMAPVYFYKEEKK